MTIGDGWRKVFRLPPSAARAARDVDAEIAFHIAMREERLRREGLSSARAHGVARERFGDPARVRDECLTIDRRYTREVRMMEWIESVAADLRYAFRAMRRAPAFTFVATLTFALGIGATTAMFTLVNGILLKPLPYPGADRLVRLIQSYPEAGLDTWGISQQNIALYRDGNTDFEAFSAYRGGTVTIRTPQGPDRLAIQWVTSDFFRVIGVQPAFGRPFTASEDTPGTNNVIVLAYGAWQSRFGGDSAAIGATLDVDGQPTQVIGVMPAGFAFPRPNVQAWMPMGLDPLRRGGFTNSGLARLKPGATPERAERQTTTIMWDWAKANGNATEPSSTGMRTIVRPLQEVMTARSAESLTVLLAAVSLILLIAAANVATLLSSRAARRQREITLRTALGASARRVVRQLLTESVALALVGAAVGTALAVGGVWLFTHSSLASLPRIDEVRVDWRVLTFTLGVSVLSGLAFGVLPAVHTLRSRHGSLAAATREGARPAARRLNNGLVVAQLSLSVVLLIAAGLVLKSFEKVSEVDLGFRPEGVTSIGLPLPARVGSSAEATLAFMNATLDRLRAVPGVRAAALGWGLPFEGNGNYDGFLIEGRPAPQSGNEGQTYQYAVSPGYFSTLGIPLRFGRDFAPGDDSASTPVAVVDEALAGRYWKGAEALGHRLRVTGDTTMYAIVGVVGDVHDGDPTTPAQPHLYVSLAQVGASRLSLAVRADGAGAIAGAIAGVRRALAEIEPTMPLDGVAPLDAVVDRSLATRRLTKILLAGFALLAVVLAGVGIYGVMSLHVANRRREFGIRMAVGADPGALLRLVLREGAALAALGVVIGILGALAATRWIATLLFGVSATDPAVYAGLSLLLAAIAWGACLVPARRAARADPLAALRAD